MAYLFDREKILLRHCPKTGITWARTALRASGYKWRNAPAVPKESRGFESILVSRKWTLSTHLAADAPEPDWTVVAVEREPVAWYESYFLHRVEREKKGMCPLDEKLGVDYRRGVQEFSRFLAAMCLNYPEGFLWQVYAAYRRGASFVLHTETLERDLRLVFPDLKPHGPINCRRNKDWHCTPEQANAIMELEGYDGQGFIGLCKRAHAYRLGGVVR